MVSVKRSKNIYFETTFFIPGVGVKRFYRFSLIHLRECSLFHGTLRIFITFRVDKSPLLLTGLFHFILWLSGSVFNVKCTCSRVFRTKRIPRGFSLTLFRYSTIIISYIILRTQMGTRKQFLLKRLMNIDTRAGIVIRQRQCIILVNKYDLENCRLNCSLLLCWIHLWRSIYEDNVERAGTFF